MKKTKLTRSLLAACSIVALSAVMYGCVHNGDDPAPAMDETDMEMPTEPDPVDPAIAQRAAISSAIGSASAALATLKDDTSDATDAEIAAVKSAIARAKAAIEEAANVPAAELAANTTAVSAIETDFSTVYTAISTANAATSLADAKGLLPRLDPDELESLTTESPAGNMPVVTVTASSADGFAAEATGFEAGDAPETISGWRGATLTHTEETVYVYSNVEDGDPKPVSHTYRELTPGSSTFAIVDAPTEVLGQIPWSAVKSDVDITETATESTFMGSVMGAMGTFVCEMAPTDCARPTVSDAGVVAGNDEDWIFKPAAGATIDIPDDAYVSFGWWLKKDVDTDGIDVGIFTSAGGDAAFVAARTETDLAGSLDGSATYEGAAVGKYALLGSTQKAGAAGHYTADSMLMVDFDADLNDQTPGDDEVGVSISGMIDNFMVGGEDPGWSVALSWDHDSGADGVQMVGDDLEGLGAGTGTTATWDVGSDLTGTGTWIATFHGTDEDDNDLPMAAIGTFNAAIGNGTVGRIVGAFGAEKQ